MEKFSQEDTLTLRRLERLVAFLSDPDFSTYYAGLISDIRLEISMLYRKFDRAEHSISRGGESYETTRT